MKVGNLHIPAGAALAPMAGVTDSIFRGICARMGCVYTVTEMVSAKGLLYNAERAEALRQIDASERITALQLFGSEPEIMRDMAVQYGGAFPIIDVNMGCPAPKIVKGGAGAALMCQPEKAAQLVQCMVLALNKPVTVKMRLGWDSQHINALDFAKRMVDAGAAALCIHGRTREQYYAGQADWDSIGQIAHHVSVPVMGNGDIDSPAKVSKMQQITGNDVVMIGRAACGNPWLFAQVSKGHMIMPDMEERIAIAMEHASKMVQAQGERVAIPAVRKHLAWYLKGIHSATTYKRAIFSANTLEDVKCILKAVARAEMS